MENLFMKSQNFDFNLAKNKINIENVIPQLLSTMDFKTSDFKLNQVSLIKLRGGGCGTSQPEKNIMEQLEIDQNLKMSSQLPQNFQTNLNDSLNFIVEGAKQIGDTNQRNTVIMKIQWFIHNREHLNYFNIDKRETSKNYELIQGNFLKLLTVLTTHLRSSGFFCQQILQICNELLRILYAFQLDNPKRFFDDDVKQEYLQYLQDFNIQLDIEQSNVWKTGIEFELIMMKIMIMNSKSNSTEGKDKLLDIFKQVAISIASFSPSENLFQSVVNGFQYLIKKGMEKKLYPIEVYQTYYLFQLIKWSIIRQLKSKQSVYKQIEQLKNAFQKYILDSENWILHFSWIQMITDIIAYRPIINKSILFNKQEPSKQFILWNSLIENNLINIVSYNKNEAIMNLFQDQERKMLSFELSNFLENYGKKKFLLFSQFLLQGDLIKTINHWDYYKEFSLKKKEKKKHEDYDIILASHELEILQTLIFNFKSQKDTILSNYSRILQQFETFFKEPSQIMIEVIKDDQYVSLEQFLEAYKKLILLSNYIYQLAKFEVAKINMLKPYLTEFQNNTTFKDSEQLKFLKNSLQRIEDFNKNQINQLITQFLNYFLIAIKFTSSTYELIQFLDTKQSTDLVNILDSFQVNQFEKLYVSFEIQFDQFTFELNMFKDSFIQLIEKKEANQIKTISIPSYNISEIIDYISQGKWINTILKNLLFQEYFSKFSLFESQLITLQDVKENYVNCKFCITTLKFLKKFFQLQDQEIRSIFSQINQQKSKQEIKQENLSVKQVFLQNILEQQRQKVDEIINQINEKGFKVGCKALVDQIQSDITLYKEEIQKIQINKQSQDISQFFLESQFVLLTVINEPNKVQILKELLANYDRKLSQVGQKDESNKNSESNQKNNEQNNQKEEIQIDDKKKCLQILNESYKYFKSFEKLLRLGLVLIHQQRNICTSNLKQEQSQTELQKKQSNEEQKIKPYIESLMKKRNEYFSEEKQAQIKMLIQFLIDQTNNKQFDPVYLKLEEFIKFFQLFFNDNSSYVGDLANQKNMKADKINDSVWKDIQNAYKETKEKILDSLDYKPDYKVREGLVYNLIKLQQTVQEQQINSFSSKYISYMWVFEKDQKVRSLLKNKELIEFQKQLFAQNLDNLQISIKDELKSRIQKLDNLQQQIKLEGNQQKREQIQLLLKNTYDELDESLENISEMSEAMDINLIFLKDISKDVKQIKVQIDSLQESINQVGDDIRKLRGKSYKELLDIRKQKILQQSKLNDVDSVYVQLHTIEYDPITGENILSEGKQTTQLMVQQWNDPNGEVNEFIWEYEILREKEQVEAEKEIEIEDKIQQKELKDVMLISGYAGSGKSKAARKIEEFLWLQEGIHSKWIPIFVSLPTLKNPKYNLFEQALESENYQFDQYQIREFKDAIQARKEKILLILDSYDEMKQDCIQQNLLMTNKLFQDLNIDKFNLNLKIIITTRKEILNSVGYQTWFYGQSLSTLKEVQLQNFNQKQQNQYINKYVELTIKRKIKEVYEFVKSISGYNFDLEEFLLIWGLISKQVHEIVQESKFSNLYGIFKNKQEVQIIQKLKTHKILEVLKEEQTTTLQKELLALWNPNQFKKSIESVQIQDLLTTPFMLEIVVQVLPNMIKMYKGSTIIKDIFIINFIKLKKQVSQSKSLIEFYRKEYNPFNQNERLRLVKFDIDQEFSRLNDEEQLSKIQKAEINETVDKLDKENFFQKYSIASILKSEGNNIIVDGYKVQLNPEDIDLVIMSLKMKKFTIFEFYESFINFYHLQQIQKQRELGKIQNYESFAFDIQQFSNSLAIDMTLRELSQINYKSQGKLDLKSNYKIERVVDDWLKQYFDMEDEYKKLIRTCILLTSKGSMHSFTHKSIQEFYVAKYIYDLLSSLNIKLDYNNSKYLNEEMEKYMAILQSSVFNDPKFNLSTDNFRNIISLIIEKILNDENIKYKLIEIVKLSKTHCYTSSASNSIYLLNQMNVYLGSQDFSQIELANTNISGLSFFNSDLSSSKFENVEINSCNFNFAQLSNVQWSNLICKEKPFLKGHTNRVVEVKFSPNGLYIASAGDENEIKLWNSQTYQLIQNLEGHTDSINTLSFSSDSSIIISGSNDYTIRNWDIRNLQNKITGVLIAKLNAQVLKVQISKDQKRLYVQDKHGLFQILNLKNEDLTLIDDEIFKLENKNKIRLFAFNPKNPIVSIAYSNQQIELIDYSTKNEEKPKIIQSPLLNQIRYMIFSPDGKYFAVASYHDVAVYDITQITIQMLSQFRFTNVRLITIQFDSTIKYLIIGTEDCIFQREIHQPKIESQEVQEKCLEIQISPDGQLAATIYENKIIIRNFQSDQLLYSQSFEFQPSEIKFSNDGTELSFLLNQGKIIKNFLIMNLNKFEIIYNLAWNNKIWNKLIISKRFEKMLVLFKLIETDQQEITGSLIIDRNKINQNLQNQILNLNIKKFCVKYNSWIIAYITSDSNSIIIYNLDKKKQIQEPLENEKKIIQNFSFSPIKNHLAAVYEQELLIWNLDLQPFGLQKRIKLNDFFISSMNYSPDGSRIGLIFENSFQIYNLIEDNFIIHQQKFQPKEIAFSIDNQQIGLITQKHEIFFFNENMNEKKLYNISKNKDFVFTPDQKCIITTYKNELILLDPSTLQNIDKKLMNINFDSVSFSQYTNIIVLQRDFIIELWNYQDNALKYIGSYLFDYSISQVEFVNDDQHLLILKKNSELILIELNFQQLQQIAIGQIDCGAFSLDGQIALNYESYLKIFNSEFQMINFLEFDLSFCKYLEFFEHKQNYILAVLRDKIVILDYLENKIISWPSSFEEGLIQSKLTLQDTLIMMQDENSVKVWDINDFNNIQLCMYQENIQSFFIYDEGKYGVGIRDGQVIRIKDIFNLNFVFPINQKEESDQLIINQESYLILTNSYKLLFYQRDNKQIFKFKDEVISFAYSEEKNLFAIFSRQNQIQLAEFLNGQFNVLYVFEEKVSNIDFVSLFLSKDGEQMIIKSEESFSVFQIKKKKNVFRKVFYLGLNDQISIIPNQAIAFQNQGTSTQKQYIALLMQNMKSFKIVDAQNLKQQVLIYSKDLSIFELGQNEEIYMNIGNKQTIIFDSIKLKVRIEENSKMNCKNILKSVGEDKFVYINDENKIILYTASTFSQSEIEITIDKITCIEYLPQQQWIAVSTDENAIIFCDLQAKNIVGSLKGHQKQINSMTVSPNGNVFASASDDKLIKLWNIQQNETSEVKQRHKYSISCLVFFEDGQTLASGSIKGLDEEVPIFLWDLVDKKLLNQLKGHTDTILCLEISFCEKQLISGSKNGTIIFWNVQYPQAAEILYYIDEFNLSINSLNISKKEPNFIILSNQNCIQKCNLKQIKKQDKRTLQLKNRFQEYQFLQADQFVYIDDKSKLKLLKLETQKQEVISTEGNKIIQIIPSKDCSQILCLQSNGYLSSYQKNKDAKWIKYYFNHLYTKHLFITPNQQLIFQLLNKSQDISSLKYQPIIIHDFNKFLSSSSEKEFLIEQQIMDDEIITFSQNLIIKFINNTITIQEISNQKIIQSFNNSQFTKNYKISYDYKYLACQSNNNSTQTFLQIWEIQNPNNFIQLKVLDQSLIEYEFSSKDSNKIYAIYKNGILMQWDVINQRVQILNVSFQLSNYIKFNFSTSLKYLLCYKDGNQIDVWQLENSEKYLEIDLIYRIGNIAFSKNDENFIVALPFQDQIILTNKIKQNHIDVIFNQSRELIIQFVNNEQKLIAMISRFLVLWQIDEQLNYQLIGYWQVLDDLLQSIQTNCFFDYDDQKQQIAINFENRIYVIKMIPTICMNSEDSFDHINDQRSVCFSPDSQYFINLTPYLKIYEVQNFKMLIESKDFQGQSASFQSNEILVIANNQEMHFINISKIDKLEEINKINYQNQIFDFALSLDYLLIQYKNENELFQQINVIPEMKSKKKKKKKKNIQIKMRDRDNQINQQVDCQDKLTKLYSKNNSLISIFYTFGKPQFSESGKYLVLNRWNNFSIINIQNIENHIFEQQHLLDQQIEHGQIFYSPDEEFIFLFTQNSIQLLNSKSLISIKNFPIDFLVKEIQISQNWKSFALMNETFVKIYLFKNQQEFELVQTINEKKHIFNCVALSPKGDLFLTGGQNKEDFTNSIQLWKLYQDSKLCINDLLSDQVKLLKFCPDGINFAAGFQDGSVNLFSINVKQLTHVSGSEQYKIFCYQSFAKQSLLQAQQCILSKQPKMQESIIQLLCQKGANQQ
ncbi:unnamed protein product [Paramecium sonneborni]|uniref:NACHT domain-containing protein n=1 Tax=Paramecium sonneborni TaxID=65129 RepID=A0A8S1PCS1_9CILI|nr:unnamed protein product [Paramecium sonneborni]